MPFPFLFFVWCLLVTLKNGFEFRFSFFVFAALSKGDLNFGFCFSFSHHFQNGFEFRFSCFVFESLWKRDFNFVFRTCIACYWKTDWSFLHEFEKWINTPVIWNSTPPPPKGMTGVMSGLSLHNHPIFIPRWARDTLEIPVFASLTGE